ncbi:MAG: ATP-binding protein [Sulfobacillus sp.]
MSLRARVALLIVLAAILPALLVAAWADASNRAATATAEQASLAAIQRQTLARNLALLEGDASAANGLIQDARSLSFTAAKYLSTTAFLVNTGRYGPAPVSGAGWHYVRRDQMALYLPQGLGINPQAVAEYDRYQAIADFLTSQPTASTPFRLTVVAQTGLAWSYPAQPGVPAGIGDARLSVNYYGRALPQNDPSGLPEWTGLHPSPFTGQEVASLITPIAVPGTFYGTVVVDVPISALVGVAPALPNSSNLLVDTAGWQVVQTSGATTPLAQASLATLSALTPVRTALKAGVGGSLETTLGTTPTLLAYTPIGSSGLADISLLPAASVKGDTQRIANSIRAATLKGFQSYATSLVVMTLMLLALGLLATRSTFRQLVRFGERVRAFGQDMSLRFDERRRDELAPLARGFNQMAERVQTLTTNLEEQVAARTTRLERQTQALAAVNGLGRRLMTIRDRDALFNEASRALGELGYQAAAVTGHPAPGFAHARLPTGADRLYVAVQGVDELGILPAVAAELGAALENRRLFALEEERQGEVRQQAVVEERSRLSREIHDTLAQAFLGIILHLRNVQLDQGDESARHREAALELATQGLEEARRSVLNLRPDLMAGTTVDQLLADVLRRWSNIWAVSVDSQLDPADMQPDRAFALMRVLQEALENVRKHAQADRVQVTLQEQGEDLVLTVHDNGRGLDPSRAEQGHGIAFMRERVEALGGHFQVVSADGVTLTIRVPKREELA